MPLDERKLEEKIRRLCADLTGAHGDEWQGSLEELRTALREHSEYMRKMVARNMARRKPKSQ